MDDEKLVATIAAIRTELLHHRPLPRNVIRLAVESLVDQEFNCIVDAADLAALSSEGRWLHAAYACIDADDLTQALHCLVMARTPRAARTPLPSYPATMTDRQVLSELFRRCGRVDRPSGFAMPYGSGASARGAEPLHS